MGTQHRWMFSIVLAGALALPGFAQDPNAQGDQSGQSSGGWRRFGDSQGGGPQANAPQNGQWQNNQNGQWQNNNDPQNGQFQNNEPQGPPPGYAPPPPQLTLAPGSWLTIRVNQPLSSDHNQPGDAFTATLEQPLVANGRVIARRGQTLSGRVATVEKAGRIKGTSSMGLEITELSLVDGQQVPIKTQLMERRGDTSVGRDVAAIGTTTGVGAAIGAAADGGVGAGIGAIAGAAASTIGVLVTRGRPTVIYPEMLLTFRVTAPLTVSTERAPDAFQPVMQQDYNQGGRRFYSSGPPRPPYYAGYYGGYYGPGYWGPGYWGSYWGPSLYFYGGRGFYRGGFRRW